MKHLWLCATFVYNPVFKGIGLNFKKRKEQMFLLQLLLWKSFDSLLTFPNLKTPKKSNEEMRPRLKKTNNYFRMCRKTHQCLSYSKVLSKIPTRASYQMRYSESHPYPSIFSLWVSMCGRVGRQARPRTPSRWWNAAVSPAAGSLADTVTIATPLWQFSGL